MLRKDVYRAVRYSSVTERVQFTLRRERAVSFPEIGLIVPAGPGDIIIDAGANVGDVTSRCARTGATVHAFEPHPLCFNILRKRFAMLPNVHVHHAGVMDRECTLGLGAPSPDDRYDALQTTIAASFVARHEGDLIEVPCIDLAAFILSLPKPVALLKMDIEGAEIPVLNRILDTCIDRVELAVVETHERLSPELARDTEALRQRIRSENLERKIRLDWI